MTMESILQWSKIGFLYRYPNVNLDLCGNLPKSITCCVSVSKEFRWVILRTEVVPISACSSDKQRISKNGELKRKLDSLRSLSKFN